MARKGELRVRVTAEDRASKTLGRITKGIIGLATAYIGIRGAQAAIGVVKSFTSAAAAQEKQIAKLATQLRNWGEGSDETLNSLTALADELQKVTQFSNTQIIAGQAMLGSFALTSEQIAQATTRMVDIAIMTEQTTGTMSDLTQVAKLMGMAMNRNAGMLSRAGIVMSDYQREQLNTAKGMEKFNILMAIMDENAKGLAQSVGKTWTGQMAIAKNQVDDLKKGVGEALTKNEAWRAVLTFTTEKLILLNSWLKENQETVKEWATKGAEFFINFGDFALTTLIDVGQFIAGFIKISAQAIGFFSKLSDKLGIALAIDKEVVALTDDIVEGAEGIATTAADAKFSIEQLSIELRDFVNAAIRESKPAIDGLTNAIAPPGGGAAGTGLVPAFVQLRNQVRFFNTDVLTMVDGIKEVKLATSDTAASALEDFEKMRQATFEIASNLGTAFVDNLIDARQNWGKFFVDFMRDTAKMILRMIVLGLIKKLFGFEKGGFVPGRGGGGFLPGFQTGGMVPGGSPFVDRVPAMLTPGEGVVNRRGMQALGPEGLEFLNRGDTFNNDINMTLNVTGGGDASNLADVIMFRVRDNLPQMIRDATRRRQV